ncbi:inositol monophosphatase family protein [Trueperella bialowiezensis]|uniref:Inositol-1-monophosphatase n=1 Tax=Trueperella bialowiezensis TaxID=312285 RepID=A0A3S4X546_9ACTO|nr:inositol monophosphatase [Trueperella bialowiezensis]VEI12904.1 Inositol-1-monophosphatase [Trueperella bialowiezensis]
MTFSPADLTASALADIAQHAARAVGPQLLAAFADPGPVEYKRDFHDPVTVHDRRAEQRIREIIFESAPGSLLLGEEEGRLIDASGTPAVAGPDDVVWLVDPIDGTANFTSGLPWWCISIAAVRGDRAIMGVIYQPTTGDMYRADETGAYENGEPIRVTDQPPHRTLVATGLPADRIDDYDGAMRGFEVLLRGTKSVRRLGSTALHLAGVADGTFGATCGMATQPWDIGAGIALIEAAGGIVVGLNADHTRATSRVFACPHYVGAAHQEAAQLALDALNHVQPQDFDHVGSNS